MNGLLVLAIVMLYGVIMNNAPVKLAVIVSRGYRRGVLLPDLKGVNTSEQIAFTYNEPTLQAEYIYFSSHILHENNIAVVLVTNGAMSSETASELISCMGNDEAVNIDIKAFNVVLAGTVYPGHIRNSEIQKR